jgi:hypothetical protein
LAASDLQEPIKNRVEHARKYRRQDYRHDEDADHVEKGDAGANEKD